MSLKKNFLYSTVLTISNYIFPLLTFPYVSRVLGVKNIGLIGFVDSIINYFILFSMLGIAATGIREVARVKNNYQSLQKVFSSLFLLCAISTVVALILLVLATFFVPQLKENMDFLLLGSIKLVFNLFLIEWFFKGIEDFKYITLRSVIVKLVFVISVFLFVKNQEDYFTYYLLMIGLVTITAIINWTYRRKFVKFSFKNINLKPFLKSYFTIGIYLILTSLYTTFNIAYLGFVTNEKQVGFYTTATQIFTISLSLFTALTTVMLPRMSALIVEGNMNEVKRLALKSYDFLISFSLPLIIITIIFAPQIINILAGAGYEGAILPLQIILPLILVVGIEQILVLQLLMPLKKDKCILINSIVGALIGIILNILLVEKFQSVGSAFVWVFSELSVLMVAQYFVSKNFSISFPLKKLLVNILYCLPILGIGLLVKTLVALPDILLLFLVTLITLAYVLFIQLSLIKNSFFIETYNSLIKKKIQS